jgi:hypothetical protein
MADDDELDGEGEQGLGYGQGEETAESEETLSPDELDADE